MDIGQKNIYERFVWFDERVRAGKYPNASFLARQFEVSLKTAQRDIDFMRDRMKSPLVYDRSLKGYYYESDSYALPLTYLSSDELSSLLLAKKLLEDVSGDFLKNELDSVLNKITSILGTHLDKTDIIDEVVSSQRLRYSPVSEDIFKNILGASIRKKPLEVTYYSPTNDEETRRRIDPYHMLNYNGSWYLLAYCHMRRELRIFQMGRIKALTVLDASFTVRRGVDVHGFLEDCFGIFKGKSRQTVILRFNPEKSRWVKEQVWHKDQKMKSLKDGSIELSFPVSSFLEVQMEVMRHGSSVEVIKPEAFRKSVRAELEQALKNYSDSNQ